MPADDEAKNESLKERRELYNLTPDAPESAIMQKEREEAEEVDRKYFEISAVAKEKTEKEDLEFQNRTVEYIERIVNDYSQQKLKLLSADIKILLRGLKHIDTDESWALRFKLKSAGANTEDMLNSITGLTSDIAWGWRENMFLAYPEEVVESLVGIGDDVPKARYYREKLVESDQVPEHAKTNVILKSYAGVFSVPTMKLRKNALEKLTTGALDTDLAKALLASLVGVYDALGYEIRTKIYDMVAAKPRMNDKAYSELPLTIAHSLVGDFSDEAEKIRNKLKRSGDFGEAALLISLGGIDSPNADEIREEARKELSFHSPRHNIAAPNIGPSDKEQEHKIKFRHNNKASALLYSLRGVNSPKANVLRHSLETSGINKVIMAEFLYGGKSW